MGRYWLCLVLVSVAAGLGETAPQANEGVKPRNVTVKPSAQSLEIRWKGPEENLADVESYRVRVTPVADQARKRVHWVPAMADLVETVPCLQPSTQYEVQVYCRFSKRLNITDAGSLTVITSTLPKVEVGFLVSVWEQRVYVMIGAVIMTVVFLFFVPCLCCYLHARKHKSVRLDRVQNGKKNAIALRKKTSDSTTEDRYSVEPVHAIAHRPALPYGSSSHQLSPVNRSPPPSYNPSAPRTTSVPLELAPGRPPLPCPRGHAEPVDFDGADDYQNEAFFAGEDMDTYVNEVFPPPRPRREADESVYGNMQY